MDAFTPELPGTVTGAESLTGVTGLTIAEVKVGSHGVFLSMTTHASFGTPIADPTSRGRQILRLTATLLNE